VTGTDELTPIERLLREALAPLDRESLAVPEKVTRGAVRRGSQLRRIRRATIAVVPVMAAAVVVATVLSVQATTPQGGRSADGPPAAGASVAGVPAGGVNAQGWQLATRSPLSPRGNATLVNAGREVLVLGGSDADPCPPNALCIGQPERGLRDSAAYDPDHNRWRMLAEAPIQLQDISAEVAGDVVYVLTRSSALPDGQRLFGYSIAHDRWTALPDPPTRIDNLAAVGEGRLVGYLYSHGRTWRPDQVYDVASHTWSAMPRDPLAPSRDRNLVATADGNLVLIAVDQPWNPNTPKSDLWQAAAWEAQSGTWRELPPSGIVDSDPTWWWAAGRLVNPSIQIVDDDQGSAPAGGTLDPVSGTWGAIPPRTPRTSEPPLPAAAGGDRVLYGGQVLDVRAGIWWPVPSPPTSFPTQDGSVLIAGDRVIVFGGARFSSFKGTLTGDTWVLPLPAS
jgi:hypothetical protein